MPPITGLLLTQKADVKSAKLSLTETGELTMTGIKLTLKKKETPEIIGTYKAGKGVFIHLFGFTKGRAGSENKHELPPPHDSQLLFGDILVVASKEEDSFVQPITFKTEDYEAFYTKAFGGFEDLDGDEEEEEEEEEVTEDADAKEFDDVAEEAEEEEEAEEAEEEEEAEEDAGEEIEEAEEVEERPKRATKAKKAATPSARKSTKRTAAAVNTFGTYVTIAPEAELKEGIAAGEQPQRIKALAALTTLFEAHLNAENIAALELCIYNASLREATRRHVARAWTHPPFVQLYEMSARRISANFHPESYVKNTELYSRFKNGYITFDEISGMNNYELFEGRWAENFQQQQIREKRQLEGNKSMATDRFLCSRCHKRECTYYEMQTRSADEPMTIFITCLNCGKHWRQ